MWKCWKVLSIPVMSSSWKIIATVIAAAPTIVLMLILLLKRGLSLISIITAHDVPRTPQLKRLQKSLVNHQQS